MVCSSGSRHNRGHMLHGMQGPIFVAIAAALRIKPCKNNCLTSLKNRNFKSVRDLVTRLGSSATATQQDAVTERLLMCLYFSKQSIIVDWVTFAHNMTEGTACNELQEFFDEWLQKHHPHATTLLRAIILALHANPALTGEQAAFCFKPLPEPVIGDMVYLLYLLLHRSCAMVSIPYTLAHEQKTLVVRFTSDQVHPNYFCAPP